VIRTIEVYFGDGHRTARIGSSERVMTACPARENGGVG
jgi:hypothetical protein